MSEAHRLLLAEALAKTADQDEATKDAMLLGFVAVAEWMDPDGQRWLTLVDSNATGELLPKWVTRGYLHEALFCWTSAEGIDE